MAVFARKVHVVRSDLTTQSYSQRLPDHVATLHSGKNSALKIVETKYNFYSHPSGSQHVKT